MTPRHLTTQEALRFATTQQHADALRARNCPCIVALDTGNGHPDIFVFGKRGDLKGLMRELDMRIERVAPADLATPEREPRKWEGGTQ